MNLYLIIKNPSFILEFKKAKTKDELKNLANKAIKQIDDKKYDTNIKREGINNTIKLGIAFYKKEIYIDSKIENDLC